MSEETKRPAEETPEEPKEVPQEEAPPTEEAPETAGILPLRDIGILIGNKIGS